VDLAYQLTCYAGHLLHLCTTWKAQVHHILGNEARNQSWGPEETDLARALMFKDKSFEGPWYDDDDDDSGRSEGEDVLGNDLVLEALDSCI
jgi:hypothetical protein